MFGYVSGDMLGSPRTLFAFARDGVLPPALARVHPRFHTPYVAIVVYACIVGDAGDQQQLHAARDAGERRGADAVSDVRDRVVRAAAARRPRRRRDPFAVPGGPVIPILAAIVIVWLLSNATRREFGVEALVLAVAALFYFIRRTGGQL